MTKSEESRAQPLWLERWGWVALVAVALILFVRSLSPGLTMAQGDVSNVGVRQSYDSHPNLFVARWFPDEGMGTPGPGVALAPSTFLWWVVPHVKYVDFCYLFHIILFGVGGWFLLRDLTKNATAALVGGIWFMLQPHAFSHMQPGHVGYFWTCAWMPWCLFFLRLAVAMGHVGWWTLAGGCAGLTLTGQPDVGVLFLMFVFAYGVYLLVSDTMARASTAPAVLRCVAGAVGKGALAGVVCVLLGYQVLIGSYRAFEQPKREAPVAAETKSADEQAREKWLWATQWSVPVEESLDFIIPGLFGWGSSYRSNPYRGRVGQTEGFPQHRQGLPNLNDVSNYVGAFIMLGCVLAVVAGRKRGEVWFLLAGGLLACLLSFGKHAPVYRLFFELPHMSSMRNPIKWFAVASLCFGMLGSIGMSEALSKESVFSRMSGLWKALVCFAPGIVAIVSAAVFLSGFAPGCMFWDAAAVERGWGSFAAGMLFWSLSGAIYFWAMRSGKPESSLASGAGTSGRILPWVASLLVLVEVLNVDLRYMPYNSADTGIRGDGMTEFLNSQKRPFRILLSTMNGAYRYINDVMCAYYRWERPSITVMRSEDDSAVFMRNLSSDPKKMLQLTNVRYFLSPGRIGDPDFVPVVAMKYGNSPVIVHRFTNSLPRYYVASQWEAIPEDKALARLAEADFDPRRSVLVHVEREKLPALPSSPVDATCEITEYMPGKAIIRTRTSHDAVLVGLERFDPSWAVFVDGKAVPMWKADWMLRACPIPAGEHTVEWRVVGDGGVGFWMGVAGWALTAAAAAWLGFDALKAGRKCG